MTIERIDRPAYPEPSRDDYFEFLVRCYFGAGNDLLSLCIRRAYRDMNRTLHGLRHIKTIERLREQASQTTRSLLRELPENKIASFRAFDTWHERACARLISVYRDHGFALSVGQAQKWLNMAMKYIFTLGEDRLPGYAALYKFAHVPIDNIVLKAVAERGGPTLDGAWSRLNDYEIYLDYQHRCRRLFAGSSPLAAEFSLWQEY